MDSQGLGKAIADAATMFIGIVIVVTAVVAVGLWELFWWLWSHISITWGQ